MGRKASSHPRAWALARSVPSLLAAALATPTPAAAKPARPVLADVRCYARDIQVDLAYARPQNAFRKRLYHSNVALLRPAVAMRLARVQVRLRKQGLGLKILDAYRPRSVQYRMWKLRPDGRQRYIANPRKGSKHNRGAAIDLTLVDRRGRELRMPTPYDTFSPRAHRGAARGIPVQARRNAQTLRAAMVAEGFRSNPYEWWHFDAPDWRSYALLNRPLPRIFGPPAPKRSGVEAL